MAHLKKKSLPEATFFDQKKDCLPIRILPFSDHFVEIIVDFGEPTKNPMSLELIPIKNTPNFD